MRTNVFFQKIKEKDWLRKYVGYFNDELLEIDAQGFLPSKRGKKIVIVSKKWYREKWQTYSSVSLKELKNILKLRRVEGGVTGLQVFYTNQQQEGYDVKTIDFDQEVLSKFQNVVLIPETELITHDFKDLRDVFEIETPAGILFHAIIDGKTCSANKQGLMSTVELFSLSLGLSQSANFKKVILDDYTTFLWGNLKKFPISKINKIAVFDFKSSISFKSLHSLYWAPLVSAALFVLAMNAYYMYQTNQLTSRLSEYKVGVSELLNKKQAADKAKSYVEQVSNDISQYPNLHNHWDIAYFAIEEGMDIQQFTGSKSLIRIRGFADSASKTLTAMNNLPQLSSVQFDGPVRKSGARDYFVMELRLVEKNEE
ncbi:hypothetical protein ORJ66_11015 [Pseudoalteromonas tunicata]|uniref:hypothetical protein n=1 Tax=Pseudoalteromonas tunicata TaxID=314281 RepID=UPI00273E778B|nr:hypothetical protein [Pseudoalteromonas tunicata]MDP5213572.1 hypothetical protein [Pseudoalteromonas tunicata]